MEITVSVLLLSSIRLQVANDLSAITLAHTSVPVCEKNPPNLTFPIKHHVCNTFKYESSSPLDSLPLEVLTEILMNERICYVWNLPKTSQFGIRKEELEEGWH